MAKASPMLAGIDVGVFVIVRNWLGSSMRQACCIQDSLSTSDFLSVVWATSASIWAVATAIVFLSHTHC